MERPEIGAAMRFVAEVWQPGGTIARRLSG